MELLDRYAAASPLVTWEEADVSPEPWTADQIPRLHSSDQTVSNDSLIVYCETTDRWKILSPADFISLSLNYEEGVYEIAGLTYEQRDHLRHFLRDAGHPSRGWLILQGQGELVRERHHGSCVAA
jgi:hypothetical protein